ncbi:hypothetical protein V2G26_010591 [Clonostachys chloroleuca]
MATQTELPFVTLDVFTSTRFKGNPLAVVTIPAGTKPYPTQEQKQTIAREFNLSETVFIHEEHPDVDPKDKSTRRIDIFITTAELPFAGHPTIGAAVSLLDKGITTLITKAGPIPLQQPEPNTIQAAIPFNVHLHKKTLSVLSADQPNSFAPGDLSVVPEIQAAELAAPIFSIVNGMAFILIELPTVELLSKVTGSATSFPVDQTLDPGWRGIPRALLLRARQPSAWHRGHPLAHDREELRGSRYRERGLRSLVVPYPCRGGYGA